MKNLLGIDIGGTKCAVVYGLVSNDNIEIVDKIRFATLDCKATLDKLVEAVDEMMKRHQLTKDNTEAIGISCGGPLDSTKGVIMSPPNLPGWDNVPVCDIFSSRFSIPTVLENDANACALAEFYWGAGKGSQNMVFLTFGTGLGAGIIINGKLYSGSNGNAGEVGHIRLSDFGPVGFAKAGSFEGFCSGGGIAQLAAMRIKEQAQLGQQTFFQRPLSELNTLTTKDVAEAAAQGDELAIDIFNTSAEYLGKGLSVIIDILNPQVIVIGSVFARAEKFFRKGMEKIISQEALSSSAQICSIRPAQLDEKIGDYAALSLAMSYSNN